MITSLCLLVGLLLLCVLAYVCACCDLFLYVCVCFHSWPGHWAPDRQFPSGAPVAGWAKDTSNPLRGAPGRHSQPRARQDGH